MRLAWLCTCLWPGLSRLWIAGHWSGLFVAIAFSAVLNLVLAATFIWPEWLDPNVLVASILAAIGFWIVSAYSSLRWVRSTAACQFGDAELELASSPEPNELAQTDRRPTVGGDATSFAGLLSAAQAEYLKGHWFEAEATLKQILTRNPRDVEARLLWVSVLRRSRRADAAKRQLKILSRLEGAEVWALEIRDERVRVARLLKDEKAKQAEGRPDPNEGPSKDVDSFHPATAAKQVADSRIESVEPGEAIPPQIIDGQLPVGDAASLSEAA